MSLPGFQEFMFPILKFLSEKEKADKKEIFNQMIKVFKLTEEQLSEKLPSQVEPTYKNRISWALTYLKKAGLLDSPGRARFEVTEEGKKVVDKNVVELDTKYLKNYEAFRDFQNLSHKSAKDKMQNELKEGEVQTPYEKISSNFEIIKKSVCDDLLNKVIEQPPEFFEELVVKLIVAMGYGGSVEDAGRATKRTNDEGIDGLIKEDKLGLDIIYIQAKRWKKGNIVGRPEIQKFVGALAGQGARKGIFITTSSFSKEARDYKPRNDTSIILIDGNALSELMYDYNIGTSVERKFELKRVDLDFFEA